MTVREPAPADGMLLEVRRLTHVYRNGEPGEVLAVHDVDLDVASGEAVALIAPSGRGKTTLLRVLAGLEAPSGGHVRVAAYELAGLKPRELDEYRRRVVGYVRQQPESGLWPHLSALRNVQVPMLGDGWTAAERTARAQRLLTAMGIGGRGEMADVLTAGGVSRWFEAGGSHVQAVQSVSFRVAEAELVAVVGRSGAGTTALLSICGGLDRPDQGSLVVAGHDMTSLAGSARDAFLQRSVGWVPQRPRLLPLLTVEENVAMVLRIGGAPDEEALRAAHASLDAIGLRGRAHHRGDELSTSQQRQVALACALVRAPALLIADQPTAHLDFDAAQGVLAILRAAADSGTAVLLATRDPGVTGVADRAFLMEGGALAERRLPW